MISVTSSMHALRRSVKVLSLAALLVAPQALSAHLPKVYSTGEQIEKPWQLSRFVEYTNARKPPVVPFVDKAGNEVTLSQFGGKLTMVNIWATWCIPCWRELPELIELQQHFAGQPFHIQPINVDEDQSVVAPLITKYKMDHVPTWMDTKGDFIHIAVIDTVPASYFFDGNGNLVGHIRGYIDWLEPAVQEYVGKLINKYAEPNFVQAEG